MGTAQQIEPVTSVPIRARPLSAKTVIVGREVGNATGVVLGPAERVLCLAREVLREAAVKSQIEPVIVLSPCRLDLAHNSEIWVRPQDVVRRRRRVDIQGAEKVEVTRSPIGERDGRLVRELVFDCQTVVDTVRNALVRG